MFISQQEFNFDGFFQSNDLKCIRMNENPFFYDMP